MGTIKAVEDRAIKKVLGGRKIDAKRNNSRGLGRYSVASATNEIPVPILRIG